jgi:predicted metal-dependent HD superfamily phosphohydrolase/phosphopantetheine adenylyltransferase
MASKKQCFIGACSDEMIKHKGPFSLIQTNYVRKKKLEEVVETNGHNSENCKYNVSTIYDTVDMAGFQEDLDCLIVTSETYKGGLYCNEVRKKNKIKPVELLTVNVIKINLNEENKISSSIIRKEILESICIEKINKICNDFKNLCKDIQCENDDLVNYWWHEILNHYTKKWKFYHNLNHIYSFIELYEKYNNLIQKEKNEFLISIFFHDIIYVPSRNDNEKESIRIFNEFYKEVKPKNLNEKKVKELIIETENHLLNKDYEDDINLFLDMDMQIVAEENWEDYENKIRKEYCFVDLNTYKAKRKEFLEGLEKKEKIFRTKTFYDEYEKIARKNIRKIIEKLSK